MRFNGNPAPVDTTGAERVLVEEPHAAPCRRCLTDADPGETVLLVSYDPWTVSSPYRQPGPVFVHERACTHATPSTLPEQQRRRLLSLRAYDESGRPVTTSVVPGAEAEGALEKAFAEPQTAFVHLHNAGPGCFAVRVDR